MKNTDQPHEKNPDKNQEAQEPDFLSGKDPDQSWGGFNEKVASTPLQKGIFAGPGSDLKMMASDTPCFPDLSIPTPSHFQGINAKESFSKEDMDAVLSEVQAWRDLNLQDDAARVVETALEKWEVEVLRSEAVDLALRRMDFAGALSHVEVLLAYPHELRPETVENFPLVFHYAGREVEAYTWAKKLETAGQPSDVAGGYNTACYALPFGKKEEAFQALLHYLGTSSGNPGGVRKTLLDSKLAPLWDYVARRPITLEDVLRWSYVPWEWVLRINKDPHQPRIVDYDDFECIPTAFHPIFEQRGANYFETKPGAWLEDGKLWREYRAWEVATCQPRLAALERLVRDLRGLYDAFLPAMVRFCADQKLNANARFLLRTYLNRHPETNPYEFPAIPGLEYWTEEWKVLWDEDPKLLQLLLSRLPGPDGEKFIYTVLRGLPPRFQNSGLGLLVLGVECQKLRDEVSAIRAHQVLRRKWPTDETPVFNLISCFVQMARWDVAKKAALSYGAFRYHAGERAFLLQQLTLKERNFMPHHPREGSLYPVPSFEMINDRLDREFLSLHAGARSTSALAS